jgi:4-hydroxybenzoate polyprenyltransferase
MHKLSLYLQLCRLPQPVGIWLLFWPCSWGILAAAKLQQSSWWEIAVILALCFIGSVLMRSAGCILNDLWDRKIDAQVARTKHRPLASGMVSVREALIILTLLLGGGLLILLQLPLRVFWLGLLALPLIALYPAMKRLTWWPQLFLGITFNLGVLMGWLMLMPQLEAPAFWLYLAGIFWTLGYDTIYAHQDAADDAKIGVKSTARLFGEATRHWVGVFFALFLTCLWLAGITPLLLLILSLPLLWQLWQLDIHNPARCGQQFRFHALYGGFISLSILGFPAYLAAVR